MERRVPKHMCIQYFLGNRRLADLSESAWEVSQILHEFAFRTCNEDLAHSVRLWSRASNAIYVESLRARHATPRMAACLAFRRCVCCGKYANEGLTHTFVVWGSDDASQTRTVCPSCFFDDDKLVQPSFLVDGTLAVCSTLSSAFHLCYLLVSSAKTEVRLISRQVWRNKRGCGFVSAKVYLLAVALKHARFRTRPLVLQIPMHKETAEHLLGKRAIRTVPPNPHAFWMAVLTESLVKSRSELVERLAFSGQSGSLLGAPPAMTAVAYSRRKQSADPSRLPRCTHSYRKPIRGSKLVSCSSCGRAYDG